MRRLAAGRRLNSAKKKSFRLMILPCYSVTMATQGIAFWSNQWERAIFV